MEENNVNVTHIWQRIICLLTERIIAFRKILIYNRRLSWRRIRERQKKLRLQYIYRLIDMQNQFILQIPRPVKKIAPREDPSQWSIKQLESYSENDWLENFRVSKDTFNKICDIVRLDLTPKVPAIRNPVPLEKRVAISLYKLATGAEYRIISNQFDVAKSTVCKFLKTFCESLIKRVGKSAISMPNKIEDLKRLNKEFEDIINLPLVTGVVDLIHVPVTAPSDVYQTFVNSAGWPSIILQGIVDNKFTFQKIDINSRNPSLFVDSHAELPKLTNIIEKQKISPYFLASSSYPLHPWLIKKYSTPCSNEQRNFNENIDKALYFPQEAFRRLFSRFKVLSKRVDIECRTMITVITACCILHNLIEKNNDTFKEEWYKQVDSTFFSSKNILQTNSNETQEGKKIRRILTSYMK